MKSSILFLIIIAFTSIFLIGILVGVYETFPYSYLKEIKNMFSVETSKQKHIETFPTSATQISSLVSIDNNIQLHEKRQLLTTFIWKNKNLPFEQTPNIIKENIKDSKFQNMSNLKQINQFDIEMEYGVKSISYLFIPESNNNKLIVYHQGHSGGFDNGKETIQELLKQNYSVLAFSMPLLGYNNQPVVETDDFGYIKLMNHNSLRLIESDEFSPIKYFIHPIFVSLNYVEKEFSFDSYHMVGLSGGGWTTVLYSAIDERISKSFPVAGTMPIFLRYEPQNFGDYEQTLPELYRIANYLELYVMGSYGEKRIQYQINNKYDPCCFSGNQSLSYEDIIQKKLTDLGTGQFFVIIDDSHDKHMISKQTMSYILNQLQK